MDYDVLEQEHKVAQGIGGAIAGGMLLGPVGLAGGLLAARKKRLAVVIWTQDRKSLVQVNEDALHKELKKRAIRSSFKR